MKNHFSALLAAIWLSAVGIGLGALLVYEYTPGQEAVVPNHWPEQSNIPHTQGQPTLIMFAHPRCPCTRASIGELSMLMTHCQNRVKARVVFFQPKGSAEDWTQTDLWRSAAAIPGVTAQADEEGT